MSMNSSIKEEYDNWIIDLATDWCSNFGEYGCLMEYLHSVPFYSTVQIPLDRNRGADGKDLRLRFVETTDEYNYNHAYLYLMDYDASMLEVMVALAIRCEENIMHDSDVGDRSYEWFYGMLMSSGLDACCDDNFDEDTAQEIVTRILERKYSKNGKGGLFTLSNPPKDLRKVEIWYQLLWYLDEVLFT